jgi:basic amino acid/polyamine antiporter, APA family
MMSEKNTTTSALSPQSAIRNPIGLFSATMMVVGNTIGVGIFTTSGVVADAVPSAGWLLVVWILGGLLALAGALTWAELGAAFPHAGGEYVYLREAFGPFWGFLCGWAIFIANFSGSIAVLAIALAGSFPQVLSLHTSDVALWTGSVGDLSFSLSYNQLFALILVWIVSLINYCGLRFGSGTQNVLSFSKLAAIAILLLAGFWRGTGDWSHFSPPFLWTPVRELLPAVGVALIPVIFAYSGWNAAAYIASEVHHPEKTLPRALLVGTVITLVVYLLLNLLYVYAVPLTVLRGVMQVGELTASALFGVKAAQIVSLLIALSIASAFNVMILTGGWIYFAMARDGVFFRSAARLHPRFQVPGNALLMQAGWTSILILSGTFEQLLTYATIVMVAFSALTVVALFVLRWQRPDLPRPYRAWGYPWLPAFYIIASVGIVLNALWERPLECFWGLILCAVGVPVYYWWRRSSIMLET